MSIQVKIIATFEELLGLRSEWECLHRVNPYRTVFGTNAWAEVWWRAYGEGLQLCTPVAYESSRAIAILPLILGGRQLRALGIPGADYFDILSIPERGPEVLESICKTLLQLSDWTTCELNNVPERSLLYSLLPNLPSWLKRLVRSRICASCSALVLGEDRHATLAAILDKPSKRKHKNKLLSRPGVLFRNLDLSTDAADHLERFFAQHVARRALTGERSRFLDRRVRKFYQLLIESPSIRESVRFSLLEENATPIAYHFGFQKDGLFLLYKPTFDIDRWDDSPGEALNLALLNNIAADESVQIFDMTCGDEAYKSQYANRATANYAISFYARSVGGAAARVLAEGKQFLRSLPRLMQNRKRALDFINSTVKARRAGEITGYASRPRFTRKEISLAEKGTKSSGGKSDYYAVSLGLAKLAEAMAVCGRPNPQLLRDARARFKRKERCVGIFSGNQLQCAVWVFFDAAANGSTVYDLWLPYAGKVEDFFDAIRVLVKQIAPLTFSPVIQEHFAPLLQRLRVEDLSDGQSPGEGTSKGRMEEDLERRSKSRKQKPPAA